MGEQKQSSFSKQHNRDLFP